MIHSIEFDKENKGGYITQHYFETKRGRKSKFARGGYETKEIDKGYKNPMLVENLLGKKFEFEGKRINVIFGQNASGKSTIIRALAGYCMCGKGKDNIDGVTNYKKYEPFDYMFVFGDDETPMKEILNSLLIKTAKNPAMVDWDGNPVYCHNFHDNFNTIDAFSGTIVDTGLSGIEYAMGRNKHSLGQNAIFILSRLANKMKELCDSQDYIKGYGDELEGLKKRINDTWIDAYKTNLDYLTDKYDSKTCPTILFDELDRSLDIRNTIQLYYEFLPKLKKKLDIQIILVSHCPYLLSDNDVIKKNYNIISLDEEYTNEIKKELKKIQF